MKEIFRMTEKWYLIRDDLDFTQRLMHATEGLFSTMKSEYKETHIALVNPRNPAFFNAYNEHWFSENSSDALTSENNF